MLPAYLGNLEHMGSLSVGTYRERALGIHGASGVEARGRSLRRWATACNRVPGARVCIKTLGLKAWELRGEGFLGVRVLGFRVVG